MRYILLLLLLVFSAAGIAQVSNRIIMIGNFYDAADKKAFVTAVKNSVTLDEGTIVLYLGNNAETPADTTTLRIAASIIDGTPAEAYFVMGYRDWNNGKEGGHRDVLQEQRFLESLGNKHIKVYPGDACPGPKNVDLKNKAELFLMDTQWWLHEHGKPDIESDCKFRTKQEILSEVEDIAKDHFDKLILFVTQHPMMNTGVHSGKFGIKQHIFPFTDSRHLSSLYLPLPVVGSLYPMTRNAITTKQDMNNAAYIEMEETGIGTLAGLRKAFDEHPYIIFISGQEHSLQLLHKNKQYQIVSGAASGGGRVLHSSRNRYTSSSTGFSVLEILDNKKVKVKFFEIKGKKAKQSYAEDILDYSVLPPLAKDTATMAVVHTDSIIASVNRKMNQTTAIQRFLVGQNYRQEWATGVKMKVFHLNSEKGGMRPTGIGGGHESRALQLEDKNGTKWVLRSLNKNLDPVTPEGFQQTIASDIAQDLLSGVNPYGSLVVPALLDTLHVAHATPEIVFVPNDTALGEFRPLFANTVMVFEERKPSLNDNKTYNTDETINNMVKESDHFADQRTFLKARLTDFLLSDFDRHHGQISWGTIDSNGRTYYYPIPKDRDQALYNNEGLIMTIGRRRAYAFMTNFFGDVKKVKNLARVGAYTDMYFTNKLTKEDWESTLAEFKASLTDSVIRNAIHNLPPEIYAIRGVQTEEQMMKRRDAIAAKGMAYYRFISKKVNILGGNKDDIFRVSQQEHGVQVQVYAKGNDSTLELRYSRLFDPAVTKEIRLYGFNGADYFDIDRNVRANIRFRIIGGKGNDTFNIKGKARNDIYDLSYEDNTILSRSHTVKYFWKSPKVNSYELNERTYNSRRFPIISAGANPDDGLLLGVGGIYKTYGFRKSPYATRQSLSALFAISRKAYQLKYRGEFIHLIRRYDLVVNADLYNPGLNYFYGLGNETIFDKTRPREYYWARYDYVAPDVLIRKKFLNDTVMSFSIGPSLYRYWYNPDFNENRILDRPSAVGLDSFGIYAPKTYAGGKAVFTINNLNDEMVPMRGINWNTEFVAQRGVSAGAQSYTRLLSTLDLYAELAAPAKLMAALHVGGGHIFSKDFEYFQALTLGANNYLRGYRRNRFSGSSMAYTSVELRYKLFNFNAYVLKGDLGLVGFNDIGRVWMKGEKSDKWHHGYGGGIYLIPFNYLMLSAVMGFSEEDKLFNVSLGTRINMVY